MEGIKMSELLTVLIIEDEELIQKMFAAQLRGKLNLIMASTQDEARELFESHHQRIWAIVLNACVAGQEINTIELAQWLRSNFKGLMIGTSGVPLFQDQLVNAGCDLGCDHSDLAKLLLTELRIE